MRQLLQSRAGGPPVPSRAGGSRSDKKPASSGLRVVPSVHSQVGERKSWLPIGAERCCFLSLRDPTGAQLTVGPPGVLATDETRMKHGLRTNGQTKKTEKWQTEK
jgi:hypothetical protein